MTENFSQRSASAMARSPWLWWTGLFLLLAFGPASVLLSQETITSPDYVQQPPNSSQYFSTMGPGVVQADPGQAGPMLGDQGASRPGQAFGALVRGGYLTGPTVGRE